jgi:hypothetical protein
VGKVHGKYKKIGEDIRDYCGLCKYIIKKIKHKMAEETTPTTPNQPAQIATNSNGFFIRVDEYKKSTETGRIAQTNHGLRINPMAVSHMTWLGYSTDGDDVWTVHFINGKTAIINWAGTNAIDEYGVPTEDVTPFEAVPA